MIPLLKEIYKFKTKQVAELKLERSQKEIINGINKVKKTRGFLKRILSNQNKNLLNIIAEIKKASPSKGIIKKDFNPEKISLQYQKGGAACISVLTDNKYFMGSNNDLIKIKKNINLPILRKDFIISEYQIYESRLIGADCILLISEILNPKTINNYISIAKELELDVIIEVHSLKDLNKFINNNNVLIGINNRNLRNMSVDKKHALNITKNISNKNNIICESGISSYNQFKELYKNGFKNFLIGEYLMKNKDPAKILRKLCSVNNEN